MNTNKRFGTALDVSLAPLLFALFLLPAMTARSSGTEQKPQDDVNLVSTRKVAAELITGDTRQRVTGRVSFHLVVSRGSIRVEGFNLIFFGVSQRLLGAPESREPLGLLGFAVAPDRLQSLTVDAKTGVITGDLDGYGDASYLAAASTGQPASNSDVVRTPTFPAKLTVTLVPDQPFVLADPDRPNQVASKLEMRVGVQKVRDLPVPAFQITLQPDRPLVDVLPRFARAAKQLCIQPVKIIRYPRPITQSGAGLAFGIPEANKQWAKTNLVFEVRGWKASFRSEYWVMSEDTGKINALRGFIQDDDCIEVFFVHDLEPEKLWGGGRTFGAGTASSQVITSDANARYGIDRTHLAHELGHVLGLDHPGGNTPGFPAASEGTLMCPSGFKNDNLQRNSQHNGRRIQNPLIMYVPIIDDSPADCNDTADCGSCPADNDPND